MTIKKLMLLLGLISVVTAQLTACQSVSKAQNTVSDKITGLFGHNEKLPEIDSKGIVDISKATIEQYEQLSANLPLNQWVYLENEKQGIYQLQNKSTEGFVLSMRLNCKISSHPPAFELQDTQGKRILYGYDKEAGQIQFLLDNKNYGNPFDPFQRQTLSHFQQQLASAQVIKLFHAGKLYRFQNQNAELLSKPVSCREHS